ncbi:MAG: sterol desaturase family protein [Erythrobacter sp.]|jgi:sterol desaturase/sphingolipid hydroxylase (fatty acid hydroxylase superfamily)
MRSRLPAVRGVTGFVLTFGILLALCEGVLRVIGPAVDAVGWAVFDLGAPLELVALATALADGLFAFLGMIALFAFFEWYQLGFADFRARYGEGLLYGATALVIAAVLQALAFAAFGGSRVEPLLRADELGPLLVLFPLVYMLVVGFFDYWLHRALHAIPLLWRLHAIHHQIEDLNAARSYSHWAQDALYFAAITVPLLFLIESPHEHVVLLTTVYLVSNYYMHTDNPALSFPPVLRHVMADNVYHRYHHSRAVEHWGRNYCSFFSLYDRIFGTQHMPQDETFHRTGIDGYKPLQGWRDYLVRPFMKEG